MKSYLDVILLLEGMVVLAVVLVDRHEQVKVRDSALLRGLADGLILGLIEYLKGDL